MHNQVIGLRVHKHLDWRVPCLHLGVSKLVPQFINFDDPQWVVVERDHPSFLAPVGCERGDTVQLFVRKRDWFVFAKVGETKVGPWWESDHGFLSLDRYFGQGDWDVTD